MQYSTSLAVGKSRICKVCCICSTYDMMKRRTAVHSGERPYECDTCGAGYYRQGTLKRHCSTMHGNSTSSDGVPTAKDQKCSICGKLWWSPWALKRHMRSHTGEKPFECDCCGKAFSVKSALKRHMTVHTGEKPYECGTCGLQFSYNNSLQLHCLRKHGKSTSSDRVPTTASDEQAAKYQTCLICGKLWLSPSLLKRHMRSHTGERPFNCDFCGKAFSIKSTLTTHYQRVHRKSTSAPAVKHPQPDQACPSVRVHGKNTSFPTKPHEAISEAAAKPQPATEQVRACPKTSLKAHQKKKHKDLAASTVSPASDRTCPHCGEFFRYPSDMKRHMTVHTGEKQFGCDVCNKIFIWKSSLNAHQKKMHTDLAAEQDRTCPICGMIFDFPSKMKRHMIQHTGEKPYQCSICVEYFSQASALGEHHQKMHKTGKERIPAKDRTCKFCNVLFATISELVQYSQDECTPLPYEVSIKQEEEEGQCSCSTGSWSVCVWHTSSCSDPLCVVLCS